MKDKIIIIVGPTAVGKTALSIELAKEFNGEIISGDSMQVYKKLDIGTAKVTIEEAKDIPHYLIDIKEVNDNYSAADFKKEAKSIIKSIMNNGKIPIIVGGTGLYIESLIYNVSHGGKADPDFEFRNAMEALANDNGRKLLWDRLNKIDPKAAEKIHPNNLVRVIRALEVPHVTGELFSTYQKERDNKELIYDPYIIGLNTDRELLYERINKRVNLMIDDGLLVEAKWLMEQANPDAQSTKGIGYAELIDYFNEQISLECAIDSIKQNSRQYAKRQLTWFRNRMPVTKWYDLVQEIDDIDQVKKDVRQFLKG